MSARHQRWIAVATVGLATAYFFWPITWAVLTGQDPPWFAWDVPEQYWPDLVYVCESLHDGQLPYWNPYDRGGYPFYADPQAATFHPVTWAICAVGGASPVLDWAVLRVIVHFFLAGLFGLLWLRRLEVPWSGAVVGAVLIEAAPFMRHNWELNLTTALAYLPLMLWAADRVATARRVADGAMLALAVGLCGWVGSPPALYYASSLTGLYLVFRLATSGPGWRASLPGIGVAVILSAGLLAVVLLPTTDLVAQSVQAHHTLEAIADGGLPPERMLALVWPQPGNHLYVGWLALLALPFAVRSTDRALAWFFVCVALLAALMAMGTDGPLFETAYLLVPGVDRFRLPHRYEAWLGPAAAALVGLASKSLVASGARRARPSQRELTLAAGLVGLGIGLVVGVPQARAPGALAGAVGALLLARSLPSPFDLRGAGAGALVTVFVLADLSQAMPAERHLREGPPPTVAEADILEPMEGVDRAMMEFGLSCRAGTRHRHPDLRGYQDPLALASWERVMASLHEHPELAPQYNVRWLVLGPHFLHGDDRNFLPPVGEILGALGNDRRYHDDRDRQVLELREVIPAAYFVPGVELERVPDRAAALARVREMAPSAVAILEGAPSPRGRARGTPIPVATADTYGRGADVVRLTISAPTRGVVVVNEAYYPGWTATVDDEPAPVLRANGFVRAVRVEPGEHVIRMVFRPRRGKALRLVLVLSWTICLALLLFGELLRRRAADRALARKAQSR